MVSSPKNILIVIPSLQVGGAEIQTIHQVNLLNERGIEVYLVVLSRHIDEELMQEIQLENDKITFLDNTIHSLTFSFLKQMKGVNVMKKLIQEKSITTVISHLPLAHFFMRWVKFKGSKVNLVHYHHAIEFQANPANTFLKKLFLAFNKFLGKKYDQQHWFASEASLQDYYQHFPARNGRVIINCVNPNIKIDLVSAQKLLTDTVISKDAFVILFPGRIHPAKGHLRFLRVFKEFCFSLDTTDRQPHLLIAGYGPLEQAASQLVRELGLTKKVTFLGKVSNKTMLALYNLVHLTVIPSFSEGFGLVAIEALTSGCLVLCSNAGGLDSIITNKHNGFKFNSKDDQELLNQLQYIHQNYPCNEIDIEATKQNAKKTYNMSHQIDQIITLLQSDRTGN